MKNKLTLKSINEFAQQNPSLTYEEQLSYFGLGDGTKANPYTCEEYCEIIDSVEPISSSFYFADGNGKVLCCLAEVVINYSGSSDESGENYEGTTYVDSYNINDPNAGVSILDELYEEFENDVYEFSASVSDFFNGLGTFPDAVANYRSENPIDITLNVNSIGLSLLPENYLVESESKGIYEVNLLSLSLIADIITRLPDPYIFAQYLSTALTVGGIRLEKIEGNEYKVLRDEYNFEMREWRNNTSRNIATFIGYLVNEGFCLNAGGVLRGLVGMIWGIGVYHDNKEIAFYTNFTGTLRLN
jgi:hypothetical protein